MLDDEIVPISALQHYGFCPRQCGLIHLEQSFEENALTIQGQSVHFKVDLDDRHTVDDRRVEYALPLFSDVLGLVGKADAVEFWNDGTPYPIEYKRGTRKERIHDDIQLTAQALCLEEMIGRKVDEGAVFYFKSKRRRTVQISDELRELTTNTILEVRKMMVSLKLPPPVNDRRCKDCSLINLCQPSIIGESSKHAKLRRELYL